MLSVLNIVYKLYDKELTNTPVFAAFGISMAKHFYEKNHNVIDKTMQELLRFQFFHCPDGEIGRHARFRFWCRKVCRFESYSGHITERFVRNVQTFGFFAQIPAEIAL